MKRFLVIGKVPFTDRIVKFHIAVFNKDDRHVAMCSGLPFKEPQYIILDYDEVRDDKECKFIVKEYELRRALLVESSPNKYWFLSFSPLPIGEICEIMFHSKADKKHCAHLFRDGFVGIRLSKKKGNPEYPKVIKTFNNAKGKNFYDFNKEKVFRYSIQKGVNIADILRDERLLEYLIKKGVDEI